MSKKEIRHRTNKIRSGEHSDWFVDDRVPVTRYEDLKRGHKLVARVKFALRRKGKL